MKNRYGGMGCRMNHRGTVGTTNCKSEEQLEQGRAGGEGRRRDADGGEVATALSVSTLPLSDGHLLRKHGSFGVQPVAQHELPPPSLRPAGQDSPGVLLNSFGVNFLKENLIISEY